MTTCYLTIDDSPSPHTDEMIDFLVDRKIPALLFCRGDFIEQNSAPIIRAIKHGFVIGNHSYSHPRFSEISFEEAVNQIEKTENLIEDTYRQADVIRRGKYFRFPHMDCGAGGYIVNYDAYPTEYRDFVTRLFAEGVNIEITPPTQDQKNHKIALQKYLTNNHFTQPFENILYPWFKNTELENTPACMYTFSSSDWMLLDRHRGKWKYKTLDDLKNKIDSDKWLNTNGNAILLMHDKIEKEILPVFKSLIDHMVEKGYEFLSVKH